MLALNQVYHGDCLEVMKDIDDNSIDAIVTDPPYGTTNCKWDSIIPLEPMWEQLKRVIKKNGAIVLTASQPFTTALISSNMRMFKYCWYWRKTKAIGFQHAKNKPMKIIEECCVFSKAPMGHVSQLKEKRMKYNPQGVVKSREKTVSSVWHGNMMGARPNQVGNKYMAYTNFPNDLFLDFKQPIGDKTIHPTQKPVALMEYLIKTYTNEGELVLDFTAGSGTTGVACKNLKRNFILIEKEEEYVDIARQRIENPNYVKPAKIKFKKGFFTEEEIKSFPGVKITTGINKF